MGGATADMELDSAPKLYVPWLIKLQSFFFLSNTAVFVTHYLEVEDEHNNELQFCQPQVSSKLIVNLPLDLGRTRLCYCWLLFIIAVIIMIIIVTIYTNSKHGT